MEHRTHYLFAVSPHLVQTQLLGEREYGFLAADLHSLFACRNPRECSNLSNHRSSSRAQQVSLSVLENISHPRCETTTTTTTTTTTRTSARPTRTAASTSTTTSSTTSHAGLPLPEHLEHKQLNKHHLKQQLQLQQGATRAQARRGDHAPHLVLHR